MSGHFPQVPSMDVHQLHHVWLPLVTQPLLLPLRRNEFWERWEICCCLPVEHSTMAVEVLHVWQFSTSAGSVLRVDWLACLKIPFSPTNGTGICSEAQRIRKKILWRIHSQAVPFRTPFSVASARAWVAGSFSRFDQSDLAGSRRLSVPTNSLWFRRKRITCVHDHCTGFLRRYG